MDDTFNYQRTIPAVAQALAAVHGPIAETGLAPGLLHLVELRASQINGCGYCVKLHTGDARRDGETSERLDRLIVWRHVNDFTAAEKAAFAWVEALTCLHQPADMAALREDLKRHFSPEQIGGLTAAVGMINLWNRVQISTH